jgi:hypothetical protein
MTDQETIQRIREYIFDNSLDLQIRYLLVTNEAHPSEYARYNLHRMLHARRLGVLVFKAAVNKALGEASPYTNDPTLIGRDFQQDHDDWVELRMLRNPPRTGRRAAQSCHRYGEQEPGLSAVASAKAEAQARVSVQQRTPVQPTSHYRHDLTRRGEGCGEPAYAKATAGTREEHKQSPLAQLLNTPKMRDLLKRIQTAIAEQEPRRERRGSPPVAATTSTEAAREPGAPLTETAPALSAPVAETPSGDELHVAAESPRPPACRPGLLFVADCGSTQRSAAVSAAWRTGGPRSSVSAGPGGACFRAAA